MSEGRTELRREREALRRRLRRAGWTEGALEGVAGGVRVQLWPIPYTGLTEGVEPRWVQGVTRREALRTVLRELGEQVPPEESEPRHAGSG